MGTVESIAPDPEHQPYTAITVRPAAKLAQLEEVLIVTGTQAELPAQAQQDLEVAAARLAADAAAAASAAATAGAGRERPGAGVTGGASRSLDLSGKKPEDAVPRRRLRCRRRMPRPGGAVPQALRRFCIRTGIRRELRRQPSGLTPGAAHAAPQAPGNAASQTQESTGRSQP